jgi:uracil-DNA glycosylase family 4
MKSYDMAAYTAVQGCTACKLGEDTAIKVAAQPGARYQPGGLCLMAEAARDDDNGVPLNGNRIAKITDQILMKAGLQRADVLTMYRVRCAPPRGRVRDHEDAVVNCDTNTRLELERYNPSVVLLLGGITIEPIFGKQAGVQRSHHMLAAKGPKHAWGQRMYVATYHPAAALIDKNVEGPIVEAMRTAASLV